MKKPTYGYLIAIAFSLGFLSFPSLSWGQNLVNTSDDTLLVVRKLRFSGNKAISDATLESLVRSKTNRELFGISGFTPWYWLWKVAPRIGESPARVKPEVLTNDLKRITEFYRSNGFLETKVISSIIEFKENKAELTYIIDEGPQTSIRNVYYAGLPELDPKKMGVFWSSSLYKSKRLNDTTFTYNQALTFEKLTLERERIIKFLKNEGYASAQNDSVTAELRIDPDQPHLIDVMFNIRHGKIYYFSDTEIRILAGTESAVDPIIQRDTLRETPSVIPPANLILSKEQNTGVKNQLLVDRLFFTPGEKFNQDNYLRTISRFQDLGMFSVRRFSLSNDGSLPDFSVTTLPVLIELQTVQKHRIGLDVFGMQRYGFGAGTGIKYSNNNIHGGAEQLDLTLRGSFELYGSQLLNATEASVRYTVPKMNFPFGFLNSNAYFRDVRTSYALSYNQVRQLNFDINANISFNHRTDIRHTSKLSSSLDLVDLELLDASATTDFVNQLNERFQSNPQLIVFILEDFRPQANSMVRYALRRTDTDIIKRIGGSFIEFTAETGGLIPYLSDRFIITPDTLEGDLPGFRLSSLNYTQYLKFTFDVRRYLRTGVYSTLALRSYLGSAFAYGINDVIPITRKFFAGGSNDIRGWYPLKLGPGNAQDDKAFNGGEIKLLGQIEYRHRLMYSSMLGGDILAGYFVDAGNVWLAPRTFLTDSDLTGNLFKFNEFWRQVAVGSGLGIRLDWDYVIFRLDMAFRVHDLEQGWFTNKKAYFHFGVGHAF
jgi:outer membrane protein assembly factor BamA